MHFQGQVLVSRPTYFTSRSLITFCIVKILVSSLDINTDQLTILGMKPGAEAVDVFANVAIFTMTVAHLFNWIGDLVSFKLWNNSSKVSLMKITGGGVPLASEISAALSEVKQLRRSVDDLKPLKNDENFDKRAREIQEDADNLAEAMLRLTKGTSVLSRWFKFSFFGWFLVLPISLAAVAIVWH